MTRFGKLTLIPTPIDSESKLNIEAFELLSSAAAIPEKNLFLVEDPKPARRRWLHFGLPRETIKEFIYFNEQTSDSAINDILKGLKSGKDAFLMSDAGLPAFCDPGVNLIDLCHHHNITVTCTPFFNSISLALALSGFNHDQFTFFGFAERKSGLRDEFLKNVMMHEKTSIVMDTPYRLRSLLESMLSIEKNMGKKRDYLLAMELGKKNEKLLRGSIKNIVNNLPGEGKPEFILVIRGLCP